MTITLSVCDVLVVSVVSQSAGEVVAGGTIAVRRYLAEPVDMPPKTFDVLERRSEGVP
jgi:hypothetical protein